MRQAAMRHRAFISLTVAGAVLVTLSGTSIAIDTTRTQVVHSIESELTLGEPEQRLAAHWDMDVREWSRYRELSQGLRGHLSGPGITPVEVLGIHARSPEERRHYARRFARLMYEDTKKVLAFQRDYDQEVRHLTQGGPLIDPEQVRIRDANAEPELVETDTILLFVKSDCPGVIACWNKRCKRTNRSRESRFISQAWSEWSLRNLKLG